MHGDPVVEARILAVYTSPPSALTDFGGGEVRAKVRRGTVTTSC